MFGEAASAFAAGAVGETLQTADIFGWFEA